MRRGTGILSEYVKLCENWITAEELDQTKSHAKSRSDPGTCVKC